MTCSFCGKTEYDVAYLIAGSGVYICDECVALCAEIINDYLFITIQRHCGGDLDMAEILATTGWGQT